MIFTKGGVPSPTKGAVAVPTTTAGVVPTTTAGVAPTTTALARRSPARRRHAAPQSQNGDRRNRNAGQRNQGETQG
jgi:hypothetical protein